MTQPLQTTILRGTDLNSGESIPYVPLRSQRSFHQSTAKFRAFVAGVGCGKTQACAVETILSCLLYPGSVNAVCRWDQKGLRDTTWKTINDILYASELNGLVTRRVNNQLESRLTFSNGSEIMGLHAKSWEKFGGLALSSAFLDECHELEDSDAWDQLCVRIDRHPVGPHRAWMAGLPEPENWIWQQFIQKKLPNHAHFGGSTFSNPFLMEGQAEELMERYGEKALVMILGSWDYVEGRLLENFSPENVLPHQTLSPAWPRYGSVDPGYSPDPAAMIRATVDPHGNIIVEAEYTGLKRQTEEWSRDIVGVNAPNPPSWYVMDKSAFAQDHRTPVTVAETARQCGINARQATHNIDQAVARIRSLLTPRDDTIHPLTGKKGKFPRLYVLSSCAETIRQLRGFRMKKAGVASARKGIKLPDHGHDLVDCFTAGTMITTPQGEVPIETLKPGDLVMTRDGARPVRVARMTHQEQVVVKAEFSDGRSLIGTPAHPVWSVDRDEFVRMDSLPYCGLGMVSVWNNQALSHLPSCITEAPASIATRTPPTDAIASTTRGLSRGSSATCIAWCMNTITALSRRVMRCITGTRTPSTTSPTTSWPCQPENTDDIDTGSRMNTPPATGRGNTWPPFDLSPLNGTAPLKDWPGTPRTAAECGRTRPPSNGPVSTAARPMSASICEAMPGGARQTAPLRPVGSPGSMTKIAPARCARPPSAATATSEPSAAAVRVVRVSPVGTAPVYNLSVEGTPEYYANGVLVHNCLMYLSLEYLTPAAADAKPAMNAFWKEILNPSLEERPYLEQVSRIRIGSHH